MTEEPERGADGHGYCEWPFDLPGGPLPRSKGGDPGYPGGPPVPLTELLASGRPVFEAFASIQQTVCGESTGS